MRHLTLALALLLTMPMMARINAHSNDVQDTDTVVAATNSRIDSLQAVANRYKARLQQLTDSIRLVDSLASVEQTDDEPDNPYYYPLMLPGTLYQSPLKQQMDIQWQPARWGQNNIFNGAEDASLSRVDAANNALAQSYISHPELFVRTQADIQQAGTIRPDVETPIKNDVKVSENAPVIDIGDDLNEPVVVITRRPKFWKVTGSGSLQFTQSYFSDNWYQGGENNYSALSMITLNANYDNKRKVQWENKLEMQLGFQTQKSDTCHTFKPTSNLLRLTSKFGYKASKYWYYTGQVQAYTQIVPNSNSNSRWVTSDFLSPLNVTVSIGIDYKFSKKRFSGSLYIAPLAYNLKYVDRDLLVTNYGVDAGHHSKHTFGPNVTLNYTWTICKNVQWAARLYWFSNLHYTDIQFENTFTFTINKFLNAKFYAYPKFDDSAPKYKGKKGYLMMKEWLSLGLSYSF